MNDMPGSTQVGPPQRGPAVIAASAPRERLEQVPGLGYAGAARGGGLAIARRTARPVNRDTTSENARELDLLPATFARGGVAQLEGSRGCTNHCSFCPRGHKGLWAGARPDQLTWMLTEMRRVFDRFPQVSRTIYMVDEEFIGRDDDAVARATGMARVIHEAGFRWESSCRVDQITRPDRDLSWHAGGAGMWRDLTRHGLRRMLFGVESGVDTILDRFNKETTGAMHWRQLVSARGYRDKGADRGRRAACR
jgi:radical SAM superfamily enzyme YgiQ (UPF0313 family)